MELVNRFLRTAPTRRLLTVIAGVLVVIAAGATIAVAAAGNGPVPPPSPLAQAVHNALAAPSVQGISADIQFTNRLIGSTEIQGSDPLLTGASGRVWLSNDHRFRLELQGTNGDANVVVSNGSWWAYVPSTNTVYEGKLPAHGNARKPARQAPRAADRRRDPDRHQPRRKAPRPLGRGRPRTSPAGPPTR